MTDVLYIIGNGSLIRNFELKCSLRMLAKHGRNLGRVIVAGSGVPDFVGGLAMESRCCDIKRGKHWNIFYAINWAITECKITKPFLYSSDDHFMSRDFDLDKWKIRYRGDIPNNESTRYKKAVAQTRYTLERAGYPFKWTCWHGNTWMNPEYLDEVKWLVRTCPYDYGLEPTLLFSNIELKHNPDLFDLYVKLEHDVKARSFDEAMLYSQQEGLFSTSDDAWKDNKLRKWMRKNYGTKCCFER